HSKHGDHLIVVQEFLEGEVYDALYIDGETVALKLDGDDWRLTLDNAGTNYHNLSSEQREIVRDAAESIGAGICRVRLVDDKVVQVESKPRLELYRNESGKDVYGKVADFLTGDDD
ncbi:MAG: hypothetical protein SVU32_00570, partial [Candidatus Nanohaloarchaea archaeon]|nr:hypothetical protein [Candidatus Nanohaloarchaea archaeon]